MAGEQPGTSVPDPAEQSRKRIATDRKRARLADILVLLLVLDIVIAIAVQPHAHRGPLLPAVIRNFGSSRHPRTYHHRVYDTPEGRQIIYSVSPLWDTPGVAEGLSPFPGWQLIGAGVGLPSSSHLGILAPAFTYKTLHFSMHRTDQQTWTAAEEAIIRDGFVQALKDESYPASYVAEMRELLDNPGGVWNVNVFPLLHELCAAATVLTLFYLLPACTRVRFPPRANTPRCPHCGYDLSSTPTRCPECGHIPSPPTTSA